MSTGRYLPSVDCAKRRCSDPTALAAVPTAAKANNQPTAQPKAGRPSVSILLACRRKGRSEEHTSELQSLMRNSYAVFCLTKTTKHNDTQTQQHRIYNSQNT